MRNVSSCVCVSRLMLGPFDKEIDRWTQEAKAGNRVAGRDGDELYGNLDPSYFPLGQMCVVYGVRSDS